MFPADAVKESSVGFGSLDRYWHWNIGEVSVYSWIESDSSNNVVSDLPKRLLLKDTLLGGKVNIGVGGVALRV